MAVKKPLILPCLMDQVMRTDLAHIKAHFESSLEILTIEDGVRSGLLEDAINYALFSGGKRIRPLLVMAYADFCAPGSYKKALPAALAVEMIHTYSLIHDDLPSMDNDDFRRGRLSTHRRFDEATAILAGDALIADAFYVLSGAPIFAREQCQELAFAAGRRGLVSGQVRDLTASNSDTSFESWLLTNQAKTGYLFRASAALGALSAGANKSAVIEARRFGALFGESFQIKDDMDDDQGLSSVTTREKLEIRLQENLSVLTANLPKNALLSHLINLTF